MALHVTCDEVAEEGIQCSGPSPSAVASPALANNNNTEKGRRSLLFTAFGAMTFLALRYYGCRARTAPSPRPSGVKTRVSQYSDPASSRPARLFRNYYDVAKIPGNQSGSVYEALWPGWKMYRWAGKTSDFQHAQPPPGRSVCFVHVGKTAGSSVGCALGFRLHCPQKSQQYLPGRLPQSATHMFHGDVYDCPITSDFYLFVVRDPLARMRSAFVYGREFEREGEMAERSRKIFEDCAFLSMDELASAGLADRGAASAVCKRRAQDTVRGEELFVFHSYYNYQYHLEMIPHGSKIVVIRNEHMAEDWNTVEAMLGGAPRENLTFPHANSQPKEDRDLILGDAERTLLCHELCVEIQYYKMLLRLALNIDKAQYATSIDELQASCPKEARLNQCDFHTPNIKAKLLLGRGQRRNDPGQ